WDDGQTWTEPADFHGFYAGFAFLSDSLGIVGSHFDPQIRTKDSGHTWQSTSFTAQCFQPLALKGTKTFFAISDAFAEVWKSMDAGITWGHVYSFPFSEAPLAQYRSSGCIRGDSSRLIVQLVTGCYLSTDQGLTWRSL